MNILPEGIGILNKKGYLTFTNRSMHRILGATPDNVIKLMMNLKNNDY